MITPDQFQGTVLKFALLYHGCSDRYRAEAAAGTISRSQERVPEYIGSVPMPYAEVRFTGGSSTITLSSVERNPRVTWGVEYMLRLDQTSFDQSDRMKQLQSRGVLTYDRLGEEPNGIHQQEFAQVFFDLRDEKVTYAGWNKFLQAAISHFPDIEGASLEVGLDEFFKMFEDKHIVK
ncbi:hypothetical protein HYX12_04580 [Candidatus Woesearchaeota archaeon]|nr:hypothetical protein [Candidatus Woesearchaeota archaeon]